MANKRQTLFELFRSGVHRRSKQVDLEEHKLGKRSKKESMKIQKIGTKDVCDKQAIDECA
jgi:hypothetical protein